MTARSAPKARAELRTLRLASVAVAVATLLAVLTTTVGLARPQQFALGGWIWVLLIAAVGLPVVCGVIAPWAGSRLLRALNAAVTIEYLILFSLLTVVVLLGGLGGGEVPWFFTLTVIPVAAALIAWGQGIAFAVFAVLTLMIQLMRLYSEVDPLASLSSDVLAAFTSVGLILLFGTLIDASRDLDRSAMVTIASARRRAVDEARAAGQEKFQAFVHDELLATLLVAANSTPAMRADVARQADQARSVLGSIDQAATTQPIPVEALVADLEALTATTTRTVLQRADAREDRTSEMTVPGETAEALLGAVRQAVANSVEHAGDEASRAVIVRAHDTGIDVTVKDDGIGFELASVPPTRFGIVGSIVDRMRGVPGGNAAVESAPGAGTTVTISWEHEPATVPSPALDLPASPAPIRITRRGFTAVIVVFLVAQAGLAILAGSLTGTMPVSLMALGGLILGFVAMGRPSFSSISVGQAVTVAGVSIAVCALSLWPVPRDPDRFGDTWYIAAVAFLLIVLAARGRPWLAACAAFVATVVTVSGALFQGNDTEDVFAATNRMIAILAVGLIFIVGIRTIRRRATALYEAEAAAARTEAAASTLRAELRARSKETEALIGVMLDRLAGPEPLTVDVRLECAALEGRLRDQYRSARLAKEPLVEAAARARRRGVDVVLQDDAPTLKLSDTELNRITAWMAAQLDALESGRFTGRILPESRRAIASAVAGDQFAELSRDFRENHHF